MPDRAREVDLCPLAKDDVRGEDVARTDDGPGPEHYAVTDPRRWMHQGGGQPSKVHQILTEPLPRRTSPDRYDEVGPGRSLQQRIFSGTQVRDAQGSAQAQLGFEIIHETEEIPAARDGPLDVSDQCDYLSTETASSEDDDWRCLAHATSTVASSQ